jgi:hypothetical protein
MIFNRLAYILVVLNFSSIGLNGQPVAETVLFYNSSFEGDKSTSVLPPFWKNCNTQVPDVQPGSYGVKLVPHSGKTYLSMVAYDNGVTEAMRQKLIKPIKGGTCYRMSVYLAKSENYTQQSQSKGQMENYSKPLKLVIYGANMDSCVEDENNWLVETKAVHHNNWKKYTFFINPPNDCNILIFKAVYAADTLYNGNILIDNLSPIVPVQCTDLKVASTPSSSLRSSFTLMHLLNDVIIENGKRLQFPKKSEKLASTNTTEEAAPEERGSNVYLDNIISLFEKYPTYRLVIRVKTQGSLGKNRIVFLYNYIFKHSQLKPQQFDIQRFKAKDEEFVWTYESNDIAISFDTN